MKELKLAIEKLDNMRYWSDRIGSHEISEIQDIISLLKSLEISDIGNYNDLTQKHIRNLLINFDQNPITSNFNQFLKWRYKK